MTKVLTVGIVANEFFDTNLGRVGGFGWAASRAADVLLNHPSSHADVCYITPGKIDGSDSKRAVSGGIPLYSINGNRLQKLLQAIRVSVDILLTIDFRGNYGSVFKAMPFTPIITWVRDPRTMADIEKVKSLQLPGREDVQPAGIGTVSTHGLSSYNSFPFKNRVTLANKMPHLKKTNHEVYHLPGSDWVLPNPSVVDYSSVEVCKSDKPSVVTIGRLDPIKRPWLFMELARKFPDVDFLMLGKSHFDVSEGGWEAEHVPENLKLLGHVTGTEKHEILSAAWVFVNTSIHEESPVSVFEALAYETPVISYEDWGGIVNRYGISIGQHRGTGLEGMEDLECALKKLLDHEELRTSCGKAGRQYVEQTHNDGEFLKAFQSICLHAGVKRANKAFDVDHPG